jgi:peptidoglycan hydrolase CwlO-like protein
MDADIRSWATANEINRATRSLYGRKDWQFQTEPRREARAFDKTVDQEAIKQCNEEIKRIKLEKNEIEAPLEKISKQVDTVRRKAEERKREAVRDFNVNSKTYAISP